jgi:hypothetical protein
VNYTELKTNIEDICEQSFTDAQLAMFTDQAEQKIYNTVQIPALRRNQTGNMTATTSIWCTLRTSYTPSLWRLLTAMGTTPTC